MEQVHWRGVDGHSHDMKRAKRVFTFIVRGIQLGSIERALYVRLKGSDRLLPKRKKWRKGT